MKELPKEKILAELIAAILKKQKWNDKLEYNKLLAYYNIDRTSLRTVNELIKELKIFWQKEKYGNKPLLSKIIVNKKLKH